MSLLLSRLTTIFVVLIATISVFSFTGMAATIDMVMVLDTSGSIDPSDVAIEVRGFQDSLDSLRMNGSMRIGVVCFDVAARMVLPLTTLDETTVSDIKSAIGTITNGCGGGFLTNITDAINIAGGMLEGSDAGKKIICLATDGNPEVVDTDLEALRASANYQDRETDNIISAIGIGTLIDKQFLDRLVGPAGQGKSTLADSFVDFPPILLLKLIASVYGEQAGKNCTGIDNLSIDIMPGNRENNINTGSDGITSILFLSKLDFDAPNCIDSESLKFGRYGEEDSFIECGSWDWDMDGMIDLQCDFRTNDTEFRIGDTEGIVTGNSISVVGETVSINGFRLIDKVNIVPEERGKTYWGLSQVKQIQIGSSILFFAQGEGIAKTRVRLFDVNGMQINDSGLRDGSRIRMNLRDAGRNLANGVYFYLLEGVTTSGERFSSSIRMFAVIR